MSLHNFETISKIDYENQSVIIKEPRTKKKTKVSQHEKVNSWTLMAVIKDDDRYMAVFENLEDCKENILYIDEEGIKISLSKSLESTSVEKEKLYRGRSLEEILQSSRDILGEEILAEEGDVTYEKVASCLPPLRIPTFVGTRHTVEKVVFAYGGRSDYLDFGRTIPEIEEARKQLKAWEGLIGGWLPVIRFQIPVGNDRFWEEVVFAEEDNTRLWKQPLWYRLLLVENGKVKETHYYYNSLPFPKQEEPEAKEFYKELLKVHREWHKLFKPAMKIQVPEKRVSDFSYHSLAREMITRMREHPKDGYVDGYKKHGCGWNIIDNPQSIFGSSVTAMLEWGLIDVAKKYIDDYFTNVVYDDGTLFTMGPEIPGYGRMLTILTQYYNYTKDESLILKYRNKIFAIINFLYSLREDSKKISPDDVSHGIIRGWVENDSCYGKDPTQFMLPYFSNSTEAIRGFRDLGRVLKQIGQKISDDNLVNEGEHMINESDKMNEDLHKAIERSTIHGQDSPFLPSVAGRKEPWLWIDGRVYSTMLFSGVLTKNEVETVTQQQKRFLSLFRGWGKDGKGMLGFDVHGYAYGLLQHDMIRKFLLFYYADMAHIHSRGTWTALELANANGTEETPYCSAAQMTIPMTTKWMLVFEDSNEEILWLARGTPRLWLKQGEKIVVKDAPTRWGRINYELRSEIENGKIYGSIDLQNNTNNLTIKVRLRTPQRREIKSVKVNGEQWEDFDPKQELITLPQISKKQISIEVKVDELVFAR